MGSANPLFLKGGPQAIQTPPPLPSSTGGGRSPLRGVLRRIGRPHNGLRIIEPTLSMEAGRHQKRLGPDDGTVRAMRPVCKSVVLLCGRDWTLERVRAKDEERVGDYFPQRVSPFFSKWT